VADLVATRFGNQVSYVADVAGGQGMLARELRKRNNYTVDVIDPRGWTLRGVASRAERYSASLASHYDLVIGLHPDSALREVVESSLVTATIAIPCCNFWDPDQRLGREPLAASIASWYTKKRVHFERVELEFSGPHNFAFVTYPPSG
jgi:hypothetical protein